MVGEQARATLIAGYQGREHVLGEFPVNWEKPRSPRESGEDSYAAWLLTHEARLFWSASEFEERLQALPQTPVLSVILPTYNTHLYHLHRCIESVIGQRYPYWELCISDDASSDSRVREYLEERAANEPRIRLSFSATQGGISAASNRSIAASTGEFVVLLDHDDELHPSALLEVVRCLNAHPATDLIYSDEDKIDQLGVRSWPAFKPEFDEDLLCAFNYLGHLVAMRTTLVRQVGGFRTTPMALRTGTCCSASRRQPPPTASGTLPSRSIIGVCTRSPPPSAWMPSPTRFVHGESCWSDIWLPRARAVSGTVSFLAR